MIFDAAHPAQALFADHNADRQSSIGDCSAAVWVAAYYPNWKPDNIRAFNHLTTQTRITANPLPRTQATQFRPWRQPLCQERRAPDFRDAERVTYVKQQDADRRIPSGRNPGSGATR